MNDKDFNKMLRVKGHGYLEMMYGWTINENIMIYATFGGPNYNLNEFGRNFSKLDQVLTHNGIGGPYTVKPYDENNQNVNRSVVNCNRGSLGVNFNVNPKLKLGFEHVNLLGCLYDIYQDEVQTSEGTYIYQQTIYPHTIQNRLGLNFEHRQPVFLFGPKMLITKGYFSAPYKTDKSIYDESASIKKINTQEWLDSPGPIHPRMKDITAPIAIMGDVPAYSLYIGLMPISMNGLGVELSAGQMSNHSGGNGFFVNFNLKYNMGLTGQQRTSMSLAPGKFGSWEQ